MRSNTIKLDGAWSVKAAELDCEGEDGLRAVQRSRKGWRPARVPGEVHLDLVRAGEMPEPLQSDDIARCRWPEEKSWWYRRSFNVPARFPRHERRQLVFEGLDLYTQVFVNGSPAGEAADAFVPSVFDVAPLLKAGANELVVRMTAGSELAERHETAPPPEPGKLYGSRNWPPRRWLRKPAFAYGWDWIEPLPNIGITGTVRLEGRSHAVIAELRLDTVLRDGRAFLEIDTVVENLHAWSERAALLEMTIEPPGGKGRAVRRRWELDLPVGRSPIRDLAEVPDPQLWWPNGMGAQPLYHVTTRLLAAGVECDRREMDVGLRTVEIDRARLPDGSRFCIRVNGQEVFCKGGNWGPADAILPRADRRKCERLVAEARDAHFTMFRVNGVGTIERQAFYDACDRAGILVWQDFPFSCSTYPDDDAEFCRACRDEAEAIVASLRHHASIALWCGSNENLWGFAEWWADKPCGPARTGGTVLYNQVLPDVCRRLDPNRPYWPCSPFGGEKPNDEFSGDCHWWLPAYMNPDPERRFRHEVYDECQARFVSEFGAIAPCHVDSIRTFLRPEERDPEHHVWQMHTNTFENGALAQSIAALYADTDGLTLHELVLYGQMVQAVLLGRAVQAMRFRKGDPRAECCGALVWSYSDCWGETGWSIIDYYARRKAAWYWYRRACRPVKVIVRQRGRRLVTRIVNDTLTPRRASVELGWSRLDGTERQLRTERVAAAANGMVEVGADTIPAKREVDPREWVYGAVLNTAEGDQDQCAYPLLPHRELAAAQPQIQAKEAEGGWQIESPVYCHGVHFNDHGRAVLTDNYFDLLPGVPVTLARVDGRRSLPKLSAIAPKG